MLEIRSASTVLDVPSNQAGDFRVHVSFRGHSVRHAFAAISSFSFAFRNGDHSLEGLGIQVTSVDVHGAGRDEVTVTGRASFHDRGGHDDPYQARLTFLILADVG